MTFTYRDYLDLICLTVDYPLFLSTGLEARPHNEIDHPFVGPKSSISKDRAESVSAHARRRSVPLLDSAKVGRLIGAAHFQTAIQRTLFEIRIGSIPI